MLDPGPVPCHVSLGPSQASYTGPVWILDEGMVGSAPKGRYATSQSLFGAITQDKPPVRIPKASSKWGSGVLSNEGFVVACPFSEQGVLLVNPETNSTHYIPLSTEQLRQLGSTKELFSGSALGGDGAVYCIPYTAHYIAKVSVAQRSVTLLQGHFPDPSKWMGAVEAMGKIYSCPWDSLAILVINPEAGIVETVPIVAHAVKSGWSAPVATGGFSGCDFVRTAMCRRKACNVPSQSL